MSPSIYASLLLAFSMAAMPIMLVTSASRPRVNLSDPTPYRGDPMGSLASVEAYLDEYVAYDYINTFQLKRAIKSAKGVVPRTEGVKRLFVYLNEVGETVEQGKEPKEMELFEECRKMLAPMKLSRQLLSQIGKIFGEVGSYEKDAKENEELINEGIVLFNAHKSVLLEEAEHNGYLKLTEALEKLGHAIDATKASMNEVPNRGYIYRPGRGCDQCGEIQKLAGLAKEVMLRQIFGLYAIDGVLPISY